MGQRGGGGECGGEGVWVGRGGAVGREGGGGGSVRMQLDGLLHQTGIHC